MDDPLDSLNYHQMCIDGTPAYMGTAGTHSPSGSGQCAPEYHDQSAEDGADCSAMIMTAGPCGAAAVDPVPSANEPVTTTIQWTAGFGDEAARATTANVGDTLRFVWEGNHNVYNMPDKAAFDSCDFTSANRVDGGVSPLDFPFTDALLRTAYFACSIADHCVNGQKLAVTPTPCDSLVACDGENPGTVGVSAACYQAVGGIIQAGQAPASWTACNDAEQATVSIACQEAIGSFKESCEGR